MARRTMVTSKSGRAWPRARCLPCSTWPATTTLCGTSAAGVALAVESAGGIGGDAVLATTLFASMVVPSLLREHQVLDEGPERQRRNERQRADDEDDANEHRDEEGRVRWQRPRPGRDELLGREPTSK